MGKKNILTRSKRKKAEALLNEQQFDKARILFQQICKLDPLDADAWLMLGIIHANLGNLDKTIECNQRAIGIRPDFWEAHFNLGKALHDLGRLDEAEVSYKKTLDLNPGWPQVLNNLGNLFQVRGNPVEALECYRRAVENKPNYATAYVNMGSILHEMGRDQEAETSYLQALKVNPADPVALKNMSTTQLSQGNFENALKYGQELARFHPAQVDIPVIKARILERQGQLEQAYDFIKPLVDQGKENTEIALLYADICQRVKRYDEAVALLERVLATDDIKTNYSDRISIQFKLGALYDAAKNYEQAFKYYKAANESKRVVFNNDAFSASVDKLIETFDTQISGNLPRGSNDSERPVFIVGMPRSGTTLVEQILASHPDVYGAGELEDIRLAIANLPRLIEIQKPFPDCFADLTQQTVDQVAQVYLDHLQQLSNDARYVIDKMPGNFLHLGFIALLFPRTHIIHCMRDPLDTCLSCYFSEFKGTAHRYSYRLEDLAHYYNDYHRLMQHWYRVLDIPILNVSYSELISDQEAVIRNILEFLNLEWDDACLRFYENKRVVNTLSYNQVRQPIYTRSVGRWRHYERFLEPLKSSLVQGLNLTK